MNLLFNSDIVHLLLKTNEWRDRRPNFIFVVWSALIGSRWKVNSFLFCDTSICSTMAFPPFRI